MKNLHLLHPLHPSKLGGTRLSFGRGCTFRKSFLHRFCTFCTRWDLMRGEPEARLEPLLVFAHSLTPVECAIDLRTHEQMVASTHVRVKGWYEGELSLITWLACHPHPNPLPQGGCLKIALTDVYCRVEEQGEVAGYLIVR